MTLENLVGVSLEKIVPEAATVLRLLRAAQRNIEDARVTAISNENRFDAAYKAIMQLANAALQANGFRTLTSKPGHHMTMVQSLTRTIGLSNEKMVILDALRKQRNVADYSGDLVPNSAVEACIEHAQQLEQLVTQWLKDNRPDWMEDLK